MAWPLSQDYNEAIQSPADNFADADLRLGEPTTNALGIPLPCSGNFADVYQVRCPDGSRWAVKCFTRPVTGLRERYREISRHLRKVVLPHTVEFTYLEEGIRVGGLWRPVVKMRWAEGLTLNQFVGRHAGKPAHLEALLRVWAGMAEALRTAGVAHGDLQHGNVLLRLAGQIHSLTLKLIDYDGMYVPALAGSQTGEVGHPCYQHPQRLREATYGPDEDRFPVLLVATALRALKEKGRTLWEKYDTGDNLLFTESDLRAPTKSHLFLELTRSADPVTRAMVDHLIAALRNGMDSTPLLEGAMRPLRPAETPWYRDPRTREILTEVPAKESPPPQPPDGGGPARRPPGS